MDFLTLITDFTSTLPEWLVWALGSGLSFAESGLGLGLFFPGETAILIVSAALTNPWSAVVMAVLVAVFGCAGDHVGYLLGRRYGATIRETRLVRRFGVQHWDRSIALLEKQGARAILFTRPVPIVRILTPAAAGVAGAAYLRFLAASFSGAAIWAILYVGLGYLLRSSLDAVEKYLSRFGYVVTGVLALVVVLAIARKIVKTRREKAVAAGTAPARPESLGVVAERFVHFVRFARSRPVRTGIAIHAVLVIVLGVLVLTHAAIAALVVAGLLVLSSLPSALAMTLGLRQAAETRLTDAQARRLAAVDRVLPAIAPLALAAVGLAPWALAGTLAISLGVLGVVQVLDRRPPRALSCDAARAVVTTGASFLILAGVTIPGVGPSSGLGVLALFGAIVLAYVDGIAFVRRLVERPARRSLLH